MIVTRLLLSPRLCPRLVLTRDASSAREEAAVFAMTTEQRWRPNWSLIGVLLALSLFLVSLTGAVAALHGPRLLGYQVAPTSRAHWWRVAAVWPTSFAWDAGLRPGTLLYSTAPPTTRGSTTARMWTGRCCRVVSVPPRGDSAPQLAWLELAVATVILGIGAGTLLFARARVPAALLLSFCLTVAVGLCGVAAFAHGATWGSVLFEACWFALLPPLTPLLATALPPGGRTLALPWAALAAVAGLIVLFLTIGFIDITLYTPTRVVGGLLFVLSQALAIGIWVWRAWPARDGPHWPEYRLVLLGLGGSFGGFAVLAVLPAMLRWRLPWPPEGDSLVLLLFPASLSWALLHYRLLDLRRTVQRTAITVALLGAALCLGLALAAGGGSGVGMIVVVLLAGVGVPITQRVADRLLPDSQATYAALVQRSGEQLTLAVVPDDLGPILAAMRRGLGLAALCLRRGDTLLARAGAVDAPHACRLPVHYDGEALATLEVGEKLHHDTLLAADHEALAMFCQQLGSFLVGQRLLLQLRETVDHLEETQRRLLTARRRERERLSQRLHRGPLQEVVLLHKALPTESAAAADAARLETSLRAILTETASTLLRDFGLPAAIRAYVSYLAPYASEQCCALTMEVDEAAGVLADDESFVLYQLAHEALANAIRHSRCRQVALHLRVEEGGVVLEVCDDGCGLPPGWARVRVDHRGLRDALDLAHTVHGVSATAETITSGGTMIRARVPLVARARRIEEERAMRNEDSISILVAEDHAMVRQGLRRLLAEDERLVVVAEAGTGYEILGLVMQHQPDVLLLDLDLPGQNGLAALRAVREHAARPPRTLVLSAFQDEEYIRRACELGVAGFMSKNCDEERLRDAIHQVMAGKKVFEPAIAAIAEEQYYSPKGRFQRYTDGSEALTRAELDVLRGMLDGQTYEDIAEVLGREHGTVRCQATKICEKLGVSSRGQAVRKALQLGILHLRDE